MQTQPNSRVWDGVMMHQHYGFLELPCSFTVNIEGRRDGGDAYTIV